MMTLGLEKFKNKLMQIIYFVLHATIFFFLTIHQLLVTVYNFEGFPCLTNKDATCMLTDKRNSYMQVHENGRIKDIDMHNRH